MAIRKPQYSHDEIGPIGQILDSGVEKRRGFLTDLVTTRRDAANLADMLEAQSMTAGHTRLTVRALVRQDLMDAGIFSGAPVRVEARTTVGAINSQNGDYLPYEMVYFGKNKGIRASFEDSDMARHTAMVDAARERCELYAAINYDLNYRLMIRAAVRKGYRIWIPSPQEKQSLPQSNVTDLISLLSVFHYEEEDVRRMLARESSLLSVASIAGRVVGMAAADRVDIETSAGVVPIMEIVGASVNVDHRRNRIYGAVSSALINHVAISSTDIAILYSETNLEHPTLMEVAAVQHRQFARSESGDGYGILPAHATIGESFKDSIVTYLNREHLTRMRIHMLARGHRL